MSASTGGKGKYKKKPPACQFAVSVFGKGE